MDGIFILTLSLVMVSGYLLGSINSSLVVGKFYGNVDVRKHGSGNAGATNTLRTLGKTAAALVLAGDVLKGVVAVLLARYIGWLFLSNEGIAVYILGISGGLASILGHNWPVYFGFKGGKGVLTSAAVVFMLDWRIGLLLLVTCIFIIAVTRYVSMGSISAAVLLPVLSMIIIKGRFIDKIPVLIITLIIAALVVYRHSANIQRLLAGTESKLGRKRVES